MGKCSFNDLLKSKIDKNYPYIIMKKRIYKTGEKEKLLQDFLKSGKTQIEWCEENCVGLSTLQRWLAEYRKLSKKEVDFINQMKKDGISDEFISALITLTKQNKK